MNETVDLNFKYLEVDYVRAMRLHYSSRLRIKSDLVSCIVLAAIAAYLWSRREFDWFFFLCAIASFGLASIVFAAWTIVPRFAFRREPKFRDAYSLKFGPEGIHFKTAHIDSSLQWGLYTRALVDSHSYILYHGKSSVSVIPKRVFESSQQQQAFDRLIRESIREVVVKG